MIYNVVKNYDWTSVPRGAPIRNSTPSIKLRSYKLKSSQIMQSVRGFQALEEGGGVSGAKDFYEKLYADSTTQEDDFIFPYFGDSIRSFSNTFGDTFQSGIGGAGGMLNDLNQGVKSFVGAGAELVNLYDTAINQQERPGTYVESPKFYQYGDESDSEVDVQFVLSNTMDADSISTNKELIHKLIKINRPLRINSISMEPPRIYKLIIPGQRFIRWAYCSTLSIDMIGARREINGVVTPEAYGVKLGFKSLTTEHAGFMDEVGGGL